MKREAKETLALALLLTAIAALYCTGCGATAVQRSANASLITGGVLVTAGGIVDAARDEALDAVEERHPQLGPERNAALDVEAARWRPFGHAFDLARGMLNSWNDANEQAQISGSNDDAVWAAVKPIVLQLEAHYNEAANIARALGHNVPPLPPVLVSLLIMLGGQ